MSNVIRHRRVGNTIHVVVSPNERGPRGPRGHKGDKGDPGDKGERGEKGDIYITNVVFSEEGHLLVYLSNGTVLDAGEVQVDVLVDPQVSTESEHAVQNKAITRYVNDELDKIDMELEKQGSANIMGRVYVDDALSSSSTNPVQNKKVKEELDKQASTNVLGRVYVDAELSSQSANPVQNAAIVQGFDDLTDKAVGTNETYTIAADGWSELSDKDPYTVSATITATTPIGQNTLIELYNDNPVLFANYGFSIVAVSGQTLTIYATEQPEEAVTLTINYKGTSDESD